MNRVNIFTVSFRLLLGVIFLGSLAGCGDDAETIPPLLTLDSDISFEPTTDLSKDLRGDVELGAEVEVEVSSDAAIEGLNVDGTRWSATIVDLEVGSNVVSVTATDDRGNSRILSFDIVRE